MATISVTAKNISASEERGAVIKWFQAAVQLDLNHPAVYLDSSNKLHPAKASGSSAQAQAIGLLALADNFYGESLIQAGGWAGVVIYGPWWGGPDMALVNGETVWVGKTGTDGDIVDTAPTTPAYQFAVGRAEGNDTIFVSPGTTNPVSV